MFPGRSNNEMLKLIMHTKGKVKAKLQKQASFAARHFHPQNPNVFLAQEEDPLQKGQYCVKAVPVPQLPTRPVTAMLKSHAHKGEDVKALQMFGDFLDKCLMIDPKKRINAEEALAHPFLNILEDRMKAKA